MIDLCWGFERFGGVLKNSISEKCSEKLCVRLSCIRRSQFCFLPRFGAFHAKLDFFNSHSCFQR